MMPLLQAVGLLLIMEAAGQGHLIQNATVGLCGHWLEDPELRLDVPRIAVVIVAFSDV